MRKLIVKKLGSFYKYISIPFRGSGSDVIHEKVNDCKLYNHIIRAKTNISEIIMCNEFKYFVTITFNSKYDRFNLDSLRTKLNQRIRYLRSKTGLPLKFLFIPEKHKNGAWHFHGVLDDSFSVFEYFNINDYPSCSIFDGFGFNNLSVIQDRIKVANYVTKYVSKDFESREYGSHLYFASKGLKRGVTIKSFDYDDDIFDYKFFTFENDYCMLRICDNYVTDIDKLKLFR